MRSIKQSYKAKYGLISDLITYQVLPNQVMDQIDPFLFLNHHGPQTYERDNNGLPFGPHPHRGMETVTFIIDGDIMHTDSSGHESTMEAGGVQWMTAGSGLIHAEVSSDRFKKEGGKLEILQLWLNLPARLKMTAPFYKGLQKDAIATWQQPGGAVTMQLISGEWFGFEGSFDSKGKVNLATAYLQKNAKLELQIPKSHNIFFYVIRGAVEVNGETAEAFRLLDFNNDDENLNIYATDESILLLGHALPFNEPVVAQGPFVMNTEEEIMQAYQDYRQGKFGSWM
ncbi:MAG: pirin family protein [Cyclobacteriaceae bacterium]